MKERINTYLEGIIYILIYNDYIYRWLTLFVAKTNAQLNFCFPTLRIALFDKLSEKR